MQFPIVIHKDPGSSYGVTVPDLPGCFSGGETWEKAIESAREAILFHIECLLADGESIPPRAPLEAHQGYDGYADGVWEWVEVNVSDLLSDPVEQKPL